MCTLEEVYFQLKWKNREKEKEAEEVFSWRCVILGQAFRTDLPKAGPEVRHEANVSCAGCLLKEELSDEHEKQRTLYFLCLPGSKTPAEELQINGVSNWAGSSVLWDYNWDNRSDAIIASSFRSPLKVKRQKKLTKSPLCVCVYVINVSYMYT